MLKTNLKEPDVDSVDNFVDEDTSDAIESVTEAIAGDEGDPPVIIDDMDDEAGEDMVEDGHEKDDHDKGDKDKDEHDEDDQAMDNLYEDGVNTHDKEDYGKPDHGRNETAEKPDHEMHDKPMNHIDDDWRYPEDEYNYASSTSTIALSIPAFILTMFNK